MEVSLVASFVVGMLVLALVLKLISLPFHIIKWCVTNSLMGAIMLYAVNLFGAGVDISFVKALVAGVLGIPGVIIIVIMNLI